MHPPLTPHRHPMCLEIIEEFQKCHLDHPIGKFFGDCTELKVKLDRCFRKEKAVKRKILVPVSSPNFPSVRWSQVSAVGPNIYAIGDASTPSSRVMVMDGHSDTWSDFPSMHGARGLSRSVCVRDGKIYVTGGFNNPDSTNWIEVFDTKTQTWEFLHIPGGEKIYSAEGDELQSVWFEGTLYVRSVVKDKDVTYKVHKGRWREVDREMNYGWGKSLSYCVIEDVFYSYSYLRKIQWFDSKERVWRTLKGLNSLPIIPVYAQSYVRMVDNGGKIAVLWQAYVSGKIPREKQIWCAEIAIDKRQGGEICGRVEWLDVVATTDAQYHLTHALATTV
ncbi:unnamed protein product [Microthlaspi erraticum]|uniref:FKB95-like N-terminal Kelch domain-containing protein n=1 Tax=Microthlaspi erraticum TaxID=1685480 RepID=A0A6D2KNK7_9BRAS|nr:unnamed protein product [Microthlaspi erraticum]